MNEPGVRFTLLRHYKEMDSEHFIFLQHSILSSRKCPVTENY